MAFGTIILQFIISFVISAIIIYVASKILGETEGIWTALLAAIIGSIIFAGATFFLGTGWIATIIGTIAWPIALRSLYEIGWLKSIGIAIVIWFVNMLVSLVFPNISTQL